MTPECVSSAVSALANVIFNSCKEEDIEVLAVILTQLGDTLITMLTIKGKENC
ncbi:MAG: hypothetical protein IJO19_03855 [Clostridia bacterium]|nr:hypothetical protein [Clostridia bacterium]